MPCKIDSAITGIVVKWVALVFEYKKNAIDPLLFREEP